MTTQSIQKLEDRLKDMVGKTYLVKAVSHKILSFRIDDDKLLIVSDKKWFPAVEVQHSQKLLEQFLETEPEDEVLPAAPVQSAILSAVPDLKAILLDNIKKVQEDKGYIPQANTIAKQVNTLLNMVNTEINFNKSRGK
ncbi:hypothetical protein [Spirosoma validum]|uniref:Uncharacterized protein n=1 Tax=Spirosoma validum TaxID=2771355 RepID=A0A927GDF0_9BACT|nr:hypothetical protein [Spirosoma validum]MBD2753727.1 hypothetical protein [Spirosoma validum]